MLRQQSNTLPIRRRVFFMEKRALIFANGEIRDYPRLKTRLLPDDLLIAADGGLHHLQALGLHPHILLGDLDSVTPAEVEEARGQGGQIVRFPVDKDETDLQLAIDRAVAEGCTRIAIAGGLGGRLDQTLGNIFLLRQPSHPEISICLDDGLDEVFLITSQAVITGVPGDIVSLLPIGGPAYDVKTINLKYPLNYEKLFPEKTRGISNVMLTGSAQVSLSRGELICIHSRQSIPVSIERSKQ
jgi:thiamine pyrophosphokinase